MRRRLFYLFISLITFVIGIFACFSVALWKVNKKERKIILSTENNKTLPKQSADNAEMNEPIKNNCDDNKIKSFWDKLDKEAFLRFKKNQAEVSRKYNSALYQAQWGRLIENFNCRYFTVIEKKDLNNDGEEEIFAKGEITSNRGDREILVFRSEHGKLKPILSEIAGHIIKPDSRKFNGFSEIIIKSEHFTHGGRSINRYRFNGSFYEAVKCITEYKWETDVNGKTINYKKPRIEIEECASQENFFNYQ